MIVGDYDIRDHRCGLGVTSLSLMQRARFRSPIGSVSWLRFFRGFSSTYRQMSGNLATFVLGYHMAIVYMGWFFSFSTNASVLSCNNVGRCHFYRRLLSCIPSLRAHDLVHPRHRSFFSWDFTSKTPYAFLDSPVYDTCPASRAQSRRWRCSGLVLLKEVITGMWTDGWWCQCAGSATVPLKTLRGAVGEILVIFIKNYFSILLGKFNLHNFIYNSLKIVLFRPKHVRK